MKCNISNVFQILIFLTVLVGGVFLLLLQNFIQEKDSDINGLSTKEEEQKTVPLPEIPPSQNNQVQDVIVAEKEIEETVTNTTETSKPTKIQSVPPTTVKDEGGQTRQMAISNLQAFLSDWEGTYLNECNGKEETSECVIWKNGIEKIEATCFLNSLSAAEVTKCGEDVLDSSFQTALWSKAAESLATTTKTTVDQHGTDLAKLPEGKTVKVFEYGPTEEVSWGNETTVTYTRNGKMVTIAEVIVYEGNRGTTKFTRTISLE